MTMAFAVGLPFGRNRASPATARSICQATRTVDVAVVGAGLSGLSAAKHLLRADPTLDVLVLESADAVGGRVRTDIHPAGYVLDRGFQVVLEAYPEFATLGLDFDALELARFRPGALVRMSDGKFARVSDPVREPGTLFDTVSSAVGSLWDKAKVGVLRARAPLTSFDQIMAGQQEPDTETYLTSRLGLSPAIVDTFFRPFYQGIFLSELALQSSKNFSFVFKVLADGNISLPSRGLQAIPEQIAADLPEDVIRLNTHIERVRTSGNQIVLDGADEVINCRAAIVAVEGPSVAKLLPDLGLPPPREGRGTICFYFSKNGPPCEQLREPLLVLNGDPSDGPVNNMFCASSVAESYAPQGTSLISTTVIGSTSIGERELELKIREQMIRWFGSEEVSTWDFVRSYRVPYSQPAQNPPNNYTHEAQIAEGVYLCGDHWSMPTVNGALKSGRLASEAVIRQLAD